MISSTSSVRATVRNAAAAPRKVQRQYHGHAAIRARVLGKMRGRNFGSVAGRRDMGGTGAGRLASLRAGRLHNAAENLREFRALFAAGIPSVKQKGEVQESDEGPNAKGPFRPCVLRGEEAQHAAPDEAPDEPALEFLFQHGAERL